MRRVFELLKSFRIGLFNLRRYPKSLGEIKPNDPDHHDHQQHFSESLEVANQSHHRAAEKITGARQHKTHRKQLANESTRKRR